MSSPPAIIATVIGGSAMAWGFSGLTTTSMSWAVTWLDVAWILGGLAVACAGLYQVGSDLREDTE